MRHLKIGIPISAALAVLLGLGLNSCVDENPWGQSSNEKGRVSLTLSTDTGFQTAKPMFRSEDEEKEGNLNDFIEVPTLDDFFIKLEKVSTGETSSWTFPEFKDYIKNNQFDTGTYTLTAYCGEKGKQDFEAPYFEASTTFNVLSDQDNEIRLTAELVNSMIKINYTDAFKAYMKDYHASIRTEGIGEPITYGTLETRPLFIEPKNANLTVHFTTKGREFTSDSYIGDFPPMAKTLHNITFDLSENASTGDATLEVIFDDSLEDEVVKIDLTEELLTAPAPTIECVGFENGQTLDLLEGGNAIESIKMMATASNKIASGLLTIESANYTPSWGKEIDLCKASPDQQAAITNLGIEATGFGFNGTTTDLIATLDLTKFSQRTLPKGNHKISLIVTDEKGKVSESAAVIFDNQEITLEKVGEPSIMYASNKAEVTFDYNGLDPMTDIYFYEDGNDNRIIPSSCIEQTGTRAAEKKTYLITLPLTNTIKSNVKITAKQNGTKGLGEFTIPVSIPEYKIEAYDAFSRYAYAKISTTDPAMLGPVTENIQLKDLNIADRNLSTGIITILNLSPSTNYAITSSITGDSWNNNGSFTTETELEIPNGDFSQISNEKLESEKIQTGGNFKAGLTYKQYSSYSVSLPFGWATVNEKTAWKDCKNKNTWYMVPSSWLENGMGMMRNVGYNHDGPTIPDSSWVAASYSKNAPGDDQLVKAAGELFLGTYSFNGADQRTDGIAFSSRPQGVSFHYNYSSIDGDEGCVLINILDAMDNSLGSNSFDIPHGEGDKALFINYEMFGNKASKLIVSFKSSKSNVPPIKIPRGTELENKGYNGITNNVPANTYKAVATGSVLIIDNVKTIYEKVENPASAPKRKTNKR